MRAVFLLAAWQSLTAVVGAASIFPPDFEFPEGATLITDPARLEELEAQHNATLEALNEAAALEGDDAARLKARQNDDAPVYVSKVKGMSLVRTKGTKGGVLDAAKKIAELFFNEHDGPWYDQKYCRLNYITQGGGNEEVWVRNRGQADPTNGPGLLGNTGWNNPESTAPPVFYFDGHPDVGTFSMQFTATDRVAWSGIPNTRKCGEEGLCYPQFVFYRTDFNIVLNTWMSYDGFTEDYDPSCTSGQEDCVDLCYLWWKYPQWSNGRVIGGDCAIPCKNDENLENLPTVPKEKPRIMVLGDSISHGMHHDWTWRYRLWQWFNLNVYETTFVGPWTGTHAGGLIPENNHYPDPPLLPGETGSSYPTYPGGYEAEVPAAFANSGHGAYWGRQAVQTEDTVKGWVRDHNPDYLLLLLGFNDLGWWVRDARGLVATMGSLIARAREAKPNIKILLGNVVHRSFIGGRQDLVDQTNLYNGLIRDAIGNWYNADSPIEYVDVSSAYQCRPEGCPDGHDGLHPNAMGEYHIAAAFASALQNRFGFGPRGLQVPASIQRSPISPPTGQTTTGHAEGMLTKWNPVPNARGYVMRSRLQGMTDWWSEGGAGILNWSSWVFRDQVWEYQAKTCGDGSSCSAWGPLTSAKAVVETAPGPPNIRILPWGSDGIEFNWTPPPGFSVDRYLVYVWDQDDPNAWIATAPTKGTSHVFRGLTAGHRYATWVASYVPINGHIVGGIPGGARDVRVNGGAPPAPSVVYAENLEPTTVRIHWPAVPNAVGYSLYTRSHLDNSALSLAGGTRDTVMEIAWLWPGTWYYEFCIAAYNGNMETAPTACVTPPRWPGYKRDEGVEIPQNYTVVENVTAAYNASTMLEDSTLKMLYQLQKQQELDVSFVPTMETGEEAAWGQEW